MKHGSFKIICLIVLAFIMVFSVHGQEKAINWETKILESFNGDEDAPYVWKTEASRFISVIRDENGDTVEGDNGLAAKYPVTSYVDAYPIQVFGYESLRNPDSDQKIRSLGLRGQFDRKGYNWIDLYPVLAKDEDEKPFEIPIPGRVSNIDVWVWGANLKYYIEIYLRDYRGIVYALRLGDISYPGWRNLRVNIPSSIAQARRTLPAYAGLKFVKFRIWTQPVERVDNFYIYFKQMKILTDMFEALFDGNDLADPVHVDKLWSSN
jgi:hypothetical protein